MQDFTQQAQRAAEHARRDSGHAVRFDKAAAFSPTLRAARFRLDNGLKLVLMPDLRAPIFTYQTWFKVGSKHERPERTGLAHLFEHLMFKGTRNYPTGTFDQEMERRGAQTNAATWVDWTHYTQSLAQHDDNLARVVDFEVDRLRNLILDQATFASELEVVKNERRMSVDDSIFGLMSEVLFATAFERHPYRWSTIGSMEHLAGASLAELRAFYDTYYAPNNATVVMAGAMDLTEVLTLLAKRYGPIAAQALPEPTWSAEPPQQGPRRVELRRPLMAPQVLLGYRAPAQLDPTYAALEILSEALVAGDSARLYEELVTRQQLATEVHGFLSPFAEPGLYEILLTARPGVDPDALVDAAQAQLDRLGDGLTPFELNKARNNLEVSVLTGFQDTETCAESLGHYETNYGDFGLAFTALRRWEDVGEVELRRAAEVFSPRQRSSVIAVPEGEAGP